MRTALLALALLASGCAAGPTAAELEARQAEWSRVHGRDSPAETARRAREARADSLLSLPADSLSTADVQWLTLYHQTAMREQSEANTRAAVGAHDRTRRTVNTWLLLSLVASTVGGLIYFVTLQDAANAP